MKRTEEQMDKIRSTVEAFAQDAGVSQDEYLIMLEKATDEMKARGNIADEDIEYYALRRVQLALKMRFSSSAQEAEGFFIGKQNVFDYAKKPRKAVEDFMLEEGKQAAINNGICDSTLNPINHKTKEELEAYIEEAGRQAAIDAEKMDEEGNYLYTNDQYRNGKIIPINDYGTVAYGVFSMPGDDAPKLAMVNLRGHSATKPLPLFKMVKFGAKVNKNKSTQKFYQLSMTKAINSVGEEVDYTDFDDLIKEAVPTRRLDSLSEIQEFIELHNEFRSWCIVTGEIMEIGLGSATSNNIPIKITDISLTSMKAEENELTFWMDENLDAGLAEDAMDVVFVLNPYINAKGEITGNLIGAWVDPAFRNTSGADISADDLLESF